MKVTAQLDGRFPFSSQVKYTGTYRAGVVGSPRGYAADLLTPPSDSFPIVSC